MESDGAIIAALNDVRAEFPAMRVRTEHVQLDGELTVFRATITLPSGAEASGYGSVAGSGVAAIALAEGRALLRAMTLLGVDQDAYDLRDGSDDDREPDEREDDPYARSDRYRAVADEGPADPFNLGVSPSAAAVASATGMRLGARPGPSDDAPPVTSRNASPVGRPGSPADSEPPGDEAGSREPQAPPPPSGQATNVPASPAATTISPSTGDQTDADEDAGVSHQAFWRWAGDRGLSNRADVEDLLGQSIGGMRPAAVRDLIVAAQEGDPADG